jgi:hypothetical protein
MLRSGVKDTRTTVVKDMRQYGAFMAGRNALGTQTRKTGYKATTTQGEACMLRSGFKEARTTVDRGPR